MNYVLVRIPNGLLGPMAPQVYELQGEEFPLCAWRYGTLGGKCSGVAGIGRSEAHARLLAQHVMAPARETA